MHIVIIGSGIGGIATAIRLKNRGWDVDVYESNSYPGGKLSEIKIQGYRFDAGPSLFTMPHYVDELFGLCGESPRQFFNYEKLENICNYFWEDGIRLTAFADKELFYKEVYEKLGVEAGPLSKLLDISQKKYELTGRIFLERPLHQIGSWLRFDVLKALFNIHKLDIFTTMHDATKKHTQDPKLLQFFDRFATYNGSNPYKASGILNMIPHFEHHFGAYFPKGGMVSITNSLVELAEEKGVRFHYGQRVNKIQVENGKATGININGQYKPSDIVVSNMDIYPTYKKLLPNEKHPTKILDSERSTSALIFYWGIRKHFPELDLHNIFFSDGYREEFSCLSEGKIHSDPTVYLHISSKLHPADAPVGCENWFTMINVPYDRGQDWDKIISASKHNIVNKLSRVLGVDIAPLIECEEILDPRKIESKTSSFAGALYGTASNDRMAAFKRHGNFSSRIGNLYFCGGSVHPGGGIPLSLLSGKIVDELIDSKYNSNPIK